MFDARAAIASCGGAVRIDCEPESRLPNRAFKKNMKTRTLVSNQTYFGLEPLILRRGAERTLERLADQASANARVSAQALREDFQLDAAETGRLLQALVADRLLEADDRNGDYRPTERFREFAAAKVVRPLHREEAKQVLEAACELAAQLNVEETRNPLLIDMMAVSGSYVSTADRIGKLVLWLVVRHRDHRARRGAMTDTEGARQIGAAVRGLSPFIMVHVVTDTASVDRPFSVPFHADNVAPARSAARTTLWERAASLGRWTPGR